MPRIILSLGVLLIITGVWTSAQFTPPPSGGSGGITALTGDVTASGTGSVTASVVHVNGASVPTSKTCVGTNSSGQFIDATNNCGGGGAAGSIIGLAQWTISGGAISGLITKGVVSGVTRTSTGLYVVALTGQADANYIVSPYPVSTVANYTIANVSMGTVLSSGFGFQTVNQAGNTFEDATPVGFVIIE